MFGKSEIKKTGGGSWRFMVIPKQTKTLWIANRASCQESRNQNTSLLGGSGWKKGRCEMGFMLSFFCVCTSWIVLFFTQIILYPQQFCHHCLTEKVRLESFALFEVSVRDTESNRRKTFISPCLIPSLALFVPLPLKSFVFEFVTQILFSRRTKARRKPPPSMATK